MYLIHQNYKKSSRTFLSQNRAKQFFISKFVAVIEMEVKKKKTFHESIFGLKDEEGERGQEGKLMYNLATQKKLFSTFRSKAMETISQRS